MIIISSTTLRNDYNAISKLAREKAEHVYIIKNGEGDTVIMSIEAFKRREYLLDLKEKLLLAEEQRLSVVPTVSNVVLLPAAYDDLVKQTSQAIPFW